MLVAVHAGVDLDALCREARDLLHHRASLYAVAAAVAQLATRHGLWADTTTGQTPEGEWEVWATLRPRGSTSGVP